jgi:uncharacterized protein
MAFSSIRVIRTPLCACSLFSFLPSTEAQISIVDSGATGNQVNLDGAYTQSFDTLANTNTAPVPWVNNGTLPGWYAYQKSRGDVTAYNPSEGAQIPLGSFGTLGQIDRALGSGLGAPTGEFLHFGVQFVNDSSLLITGFDISFDGEQWFYGDAFLGRVDSLAFSYQIFDIGQGSLSIATDWIPVPELSFVSPITNTEPIYQSLNGNFSANRIAGIADSFTGLTLAPGQELWLRWTATNTASITDDALAIDNLSVRFSSVPEPAACTALVGSVVLMAALHRRRR